MYVLASRGLAASPLPRLVVGGADTCSSTSRQKLLGHSIGIATCMGCKIKFLVSMRIICRCFVDLVAQVAVVDGTLDFDHIDIRWKYLPPQYFYMYWYFQFIDYVFNVLYKARLLLSCCCTSSPFLDLGS